MDDQRDYAEENANRALLCETEEDDTEAPDTYRDLDGHEYVIRYGQRPQVHAADCDAPEHAE